MATLAEQRRASGAAMESSRRATGQSNTNTRRAIGSSIEAQRRGRGLVDDLNSVVTQTEQGRVLSSLDARGARAVARGIAQYQPRASGGSGGGIASPLLETDYTKRTYHPEIEVKSTDGLLSWKMKPIKEVYLRDAGNAEVKMIYAQPPAETP
ncbi:MULTISPECIES: hypothetical protein [Pseudomonas]|uniref:hypothetical protein n=1 Tax=Pseudomonas nitroreducens TaxID=46680 RepID=UPI001E634737|nr:MULTISPECIES: hypothetical protein [Pseudomonas]MCE4070111.1 hypothetical protein [Pseudomonas nitritireducens]MCE4078716.1 hypothetical protein [Pseudomonas nitroreducens]